MADRIFQDARALEEESCELYSVVTIGATGAVSSQDGKGMAVTRAAQGDYLCTLTDTYSKLLTASMTYLWATATDSSAQVKAEDVANATTPTVSFFFKTAGSAADPASGAKLLIKITLKNSSLP